MLHKIFIIAVRHCLIKWHGSHLISSQACMMKGGQSNYVLNKINTLTRCAIPVTLCFQILPHKLSSLALCMDVYVNKM